MRNTKINSDTPVYRIVCALCLDYDRRAEALKAQEGDTNTLLTYRYLNESIDRAIAEVCEEAIRNEMRSDIGNGIGILRTKIYFISDGTYKVRKRKSIEAIARNLHLIGEKGEREC